VEGSLFSTEKRSMKAIVLRSVLLMILVLSAASQGMSQTRQRASLAPGDVWNLEDIYPSDDAWQAAKKELASQFDQLAPFQGTLADSPGRLLECLRLDGRIDKELTRLMCYAAMKSDEDTRASTYQGMKQALEQLATDYGSKSAFIAPEVAAMDKTRIDAFLGREPGLEEYRMFLFDVLRTREHRLSVAEEKILAQAGLMASAPQSIYMIFANAELPFPTARRLASTRPASPGIAPARCGRTAGRCSTPS
jgi:oligoendopeptidase F